MLKNLLLIAALAGGSLFLAPSEPGSCGGGSTWGGTCGVGNSGGSITVSGSAGSGGGSNSGGENSGAGGNSGGENSGGGNSGNNGGGYNNGGGNSGGGGVWDAEAEARANAEVIARNPNFVGPVAESCVINRCIGRFTPDDAPVVVAPADPADPAAPAGPITYPTVVAADLVRFTPGSPIFASEPGGVAVVGMPANFVAYASAHEIVGELFGFAVTVRFTPAGYVFVYGDGQSRASPTGGATWDALGLAQFTPTATSNTYLERGSYTASVAVSYAAEVSFGTGTWFPVTGYVQSGSGGQTVRVVSVSTALVDKTCVEEPEAVGCTP